MNQSSIESFLKTGYFLDYKNPKYEFDFSNIDKNKYIDFEEEELIEIGSNLFLESINKDFESNKKHLVPLSGGLDSRAVLATLLEFTEASNICTYTFGTEGSLDYDIGNLIANHVGTKHVKLPLKNFNYSMDEMMDISKRIDHQTMLFHHPPVWTVDEIAEGGLVWSGFLGDALTDTKHALTLEESELYKYFLENEQYQNKIIINRENDEINLYPHIKTNVNSTLTNYETLVYENRQLKLNAPHVLMKGYNYKTPFMDQAVLDFYWSLPNSYREKQYLYKKILLKNYPKLFSLATKNNYGLPLNASKFMKFNKRITNKLKNKINKEYIRTKNINYLNFENAIREKQDLKELIIENINDLYNRKIISWVNIKKILKDHLNNKGNFAEALLLLTSLEIHIKVKSNN